MSIGSGIFNDTNPILVRAVSRRPQAVSCHLRRLNQAHHPVRAVRPICNLQSAIWNAAVPRLDIAP